MHFDSSAGAPPPPPSKRAAIRASVSAFFSRLYQRIIIPRLDQRTRVIMAMLTEIPLFASFSRTDLRLLAEAMHTRQYKKNEYIYRERDPSLGMYFIENGRVRLVAEDENEHEHELRQVGERGMFGELAILGDFRRQESAQAMVETELIGFFQPELRTMVKRDPSTAAAILASLAKHVASQYIILSKVLSEKEGKLIARRLQDVAVIRGEVHQKQTTGGSAGSFEAKAE